MSSQRALIIDDEPDLRGLLEITLGRMGLKTDSAANVQDALYKLDATPFDICITDMNLPDGDGIEILEHIQQHHPHIPAAVITAYGSSENAVECLKAGAFDYISKPIDLTQFREIISTALKGGASNKTETATTDKVISPLLGNAPIMDTLRRTISKVAKSQAPVFISGESGTGKELIARSIHGESPRAEGPFIPVNCGAIPSELMESEFFGHLKGSFTGASRDKDGLFVSAHGGTLFLDEVADLPLHMQVKLLRAIQERKIRPVGGESEKSVDIRLLSATHKNIDEMVNQGLFRQDLYYRLNVIRIDSPTLRDHAQDIPLLARQMLTRLSPTDATVTLDPSAEAALQQHHFPGNVRELENMLERAIAMCDGGIISRGDLDINHAPATPPEASTVERRQQTSTSPSQVASFTALSLPSGVPLPDYLESIEKEIIQQALLDNRYNKTKTAEALGMSFRSFRYRVKKLGLD